LIEAHSTPASQGAELQDIRLAASSQRPPAGGGPPNIREVARRPRISRVAAASSLETQSSRFCAMSFRCFAARCCAATVGNKFAHAIPNSNASKKRDAQDEGKGLVAHGAALCIAF
jgi:hypothetical protein